MNQFRRCGAFREPRRGTRLVRTSPPLVHLTPYVSGGLKQLYSNIRDGSKDWLQDFGQYTDESGVFVAKPEMPLLAGRYKYLGLLGKGQSSVLIKAQDTFLRDLVSIKVLHTHYNVLGAQEMDCIRKLNQADPEGFSPILQLKTVFTFDDHYCMVFELLNPKSLLTHFKGITQPIKKMQCIRKVVLQLLQALGFFRHQNVIHADLKPENILLQNEGDFSRLKVVDLGNALHCVHDELSLYYDDFELQTLLYRAPEVMYGVPFGLEVDMWSLGCIIAELYMGEALFFGTNKKAILSKMMDVLGPLPRNIFQRGKFYEALQSYTSPSVQRDGIQVAGVLMKLLHTTDYAFADFLLGLLQYDPAKRMSVSEAAQHVFLAPELALRYLLPPPDDENKSRGYQPVILSQKSYPHSPTINPDVSKQHLTSVGLLHHGSQSNHGNVSSKGTPKKVAEILPFLRDNTLLQVAKVLNPTCREMPPCLTNNNAVINGRVASDTTLHPVVFDLCPSSEGHNGKQHDANVRGNSYVEHSHLIEGPQISIDKCAGTTVTRTKLNFDQNTHLPGNAQISPPGNFYTHFSSPLSPDAEQTDPSNPDTKKVDPSNQRMPFSPQSNSLDTEKADPSIQRMPSSAQSNSPDTKRVDPSNRRMHSSAQSNNPRNQRITSHSDSPDIEQAVPSNQRTHFSTESDSPDMNQAHPRNQRTHFSAQSDSLHRQQLMNDGGTKRKLDQAKLGDSDTWCIQGDRGSTINTTSAYIKERSDCRGSSDHHSVRSTRKQAGVSNWEAREQNTDELNESCFLSKSPGLSQNGESVSFTGRCGMMQSVILSDDSGATSSFEENVCGTPTTATTSDLSGTETSTNKNASKHIPQNIFSQSSIPSEKPSIVVSQTYSNEQFQDLYVTKSLTKACNQVAVMKNKSPRTEHIENPSSQAKYVQESPRVRAPSRSVLSNPRTIPMDATINMTPNTKARVLRSAGLMCDSVSSSSVTDDTRVAGGPATGPPSLSENESMVAGSNDDKHDLKKEIETENVGIDSEVSTFNGSHKMSKCTRYSRRKLKARDSHDTRQKLNLLGKTALKQTESRRRSRAICKRRVSFTTEAESDDWSAGSDTSTVDSLDLSGPEDNNGITNGTPTRTLCSRSRGIRGTHGTPTRTSGGRGNRSTHGTPTRTRTSGGRGNRSTHGTPTRGNLAADRAPKRTRYSVDHDTDMPQSSPEVLISEPPGQDREALELSESESSDDQSSSDTVSFCIADEVDLL